MKRLLINFTNWIKSIFNSKKKQQPEQVKASTAFEEIYQLHDINLPETENVETHNFSKKIKEVIIHDNSYFLTDKQYLYYKIIENATLEKGYINEYQLYVAFLVEKYGKLTHQDISKMMENIKHQPAAYQSKILKKLINLDLIVKHKGKISVK